MPKVLRIINRFNLGGPTYNAAYLSKYLAPEFETMLIGGSKDDSEESSEHILHNLDITPVIIKEMRRSINPFNDIFAFLKIVRIIKEFKPHIVHTHAAKAGTLGRLAAIYCKVPVIIHTFHGHVFHSYFGTFKTTIFKLIERFLCRFSTCIIAISEKQKDELTRIHKICDPKKVKVIPLGFDLDRYQENIAEKRKSFREQYQIDDDEIAIGIIGRLVPIKNHKLFIDSIAYLKQHSSKKIRAIIIGDGEERKKIETYIHFVGLDQANALINKNKTIVTFASWRKDIDVVCAGLDIVALTSFNEGTPVSLIEAQAGNKPVITTNVGGIKNVIIPDITGILCPRNNDMYFHKKMLELVESELLRENLSQKGWQHVKENFHYSRLVKETAELYKHLLNH